MSQVILFDLDGTLTESGEGITKCVQYALEKMGIEETDLDKLRCFIGPPLKEQFMKYAGFDSDQAELAVSYYRERYVEKGIFENHLYEKIPDLLELLKINDKIMGVASSKPEQYVKQILEHFTIHQYFQAVVGSEMDGRRSQKEEVIEEALIRLSMDKERDKVLMVGDREHDVQGAKNCGLQCIGVAYGYGTREELEQAGAVYIADTVEDLGILASPNDEETSEYVESVRKSENKKVKNNKKKQQEENAQKVEANVPTNVLKSLWLSLYPILIHYGIAVLVNIIFGVYYFGKAHSGQAIINPVYIMNDLMNSAILQTLISSIAAALVILSLYYKDQKKRHAGFLVLKKDFQWCPPVMWFSVIIFAVAGGQLLNDLIMVLHLNELFPGYSELVNQTMTDQPLGLMMLTIGVAAPIAEELVFRGMVFGRMKEWMKPWTAIVVSSLVFGIYHGNVVQFIFAFLVGIFLAAAYYYTGTLWISILAHVVVNLWSIVGSEWWYEMVNKLPLGMLLGMIIEILICAVPVYLFVTYAKKKEKE